MNTPLTNTTHYTRVAIALHWLMAIGIISNIVLGVYMSDLPKSDYKFGLYDYHKSIGACLMMLLFARLAWRFTHTPPALPESMSAKEQRIAHGMVHGLYLLMLLSPLSGYLMSTFGGHPVVVFGLFEMPSLVSPNESLGKFFHEAHEIANYTLCTLAVLHTLASLKHHFINHDDVLARMLPFLSKNR